MKINTLPRNLLVLGVVGVLAVPFAEARGGGHGGGGHGGGHASGGGHSQGLKQISSGNPNNGGSGPTYAAGYGPGSVGHGRMAGGRGRGGYGYGSGGYGDAGYSGGAWGTGSGWGSGVAGSMSRSGMSGSAFGGGASPQVEVQNYNWPSSGTTANFNPTVKPASMTTAEAQKGVTSLDDLIRETNRK